MADKMLRLTYDGDGCGKKVGKAIIANDEKKLHNISAKIDLGHEIVNSWVSEHGGKRISGGGDEGSFKLPKEAAQKVEDLREEYYRATGITISVGIGKDLSEAGRSLLSAKFRGKDQSVWYGPHVERDIETAREKIKTGKATQEEYKLGEAYLEKAESMLCDLHKSGMFTTGGERIPARELQHPNITASANKAKNWNPKANGGYSPKSQAGISIGQGESVREGNIPEAKEAAQRALNFQRKMPKPKLGKSCDLHKFEEDKHAPHDSKGVDDPCPYCADQEDNRTDDCQYCQDLDSEENADGTAGMHDDCPACQEYDASKQETGGIDDCPYCQPENISEVQANPEQPQDHICNCPSCPKNDQTDVAVEDMGAERPDDCPECQEMYGQAIEEQPGQTGQEDPNLQGHETAEEILTSLDQEPGSGAQTPAQEAKKIDNTEMPQGNAMEENFGDAQKQNISDADKDFQQGHDCDCPDCPGSQEAQPMDQDEPDMSGVLQSGLDDHANDQKKQQVLDMVGQTLAGFKANKASLEATKEQNQPLYNSCIQMLKSMISLCELLGLKPTAMAAPGPEGQGAPEPAQDSSPQAPPKAAPPGGAAGAPKAPGQE